MFWRKKRAREPDDMTDLIRSPYSALRPVGYCLPERMLLEIEEEALKITDDAINHNLIDKMSVEEMQEENAFFLDRIIHDMFEHPSIELKKQKLDKDRLTIGFIRMLQNAQLHKEQTDLSCAKQELELCKYILGTDNNSKAYIYKKMIGGKNYE